MALVITATAVQIEPSLAQTITSPASTPGSLLFDLEKFFSPVAIGLAYIFWIPTIVLRFLLAQPSAAVLLSAALAAVFAYFNIRTQRRLTRTRETFVTLNHDNWDQDLIRSRKIFGEIKEEMRNGSTNIAVYADSPGSGDLKDKKFIQRKVTLEAIMNDYENLAIAIRHDIVDEHYVFRYMRSAFLNDWNNLSPLVTAYRHRLSRNQLYIEFEGLAEQWENNRSFRTGRKMPKATRKLRVR